MKFCFILAYKFYIQIQSMYMYIGITNGISNVSAIPLNSNKKNLNEAKDRDNSLLHNSGTVMNKMKPKCLY